MKDWYKKIGRSTPKTFTIIDTDSHGANPVQPDIPGVNPENLDYSYVEFVHSETAIYTPISASFSSILTDTEIP